MLKTNDNGTRILPKEWRIEFSFIPDRAERDRKTFTAWMNGEITAENGAKAISMTNKVPVSKEQFLANAEWLGYWRKL